MKNRKLKTPELYKVGDKVDWDYSATDSHNRSVVANEFVKLYGVGPFPVVQVLGAEAGSQYVFLSVQGYAKIPFHSDWVLPFSRR